MFYLFVFFAELLVDWVSYIRPLGDLNITSWNPQAALQLYFLLLNKANFFPIVFAGIAGNIVIRSEDLLASNQLEPLISAFVYLCASLIFRKAFSTIIIFRKSTEFLKFLGFCIIVAFVHALIISCFYYFFGELPVEKVFRAVLAQLIGNSSGLIIFGPMLIVVHTIGMRGMLRATAGRMSVVFTVLMLAVFFYFLATSTVDNPLRFIYLIVIPVIFIALRLQIEDVVTLVLAVQIMIAGAFLFRGSSFDRVMEIQFMISVISSVVIYLSLIIIERRELQQRARMLETNRHLATMSGIILHEIAQPITALSTYSQIQLNELRSGQQIDKARLESYAKSIHDEISRVRDLFVGIREAIGQNDEGPLPAVDVVAVLMSAVGLVQPSAKAMGVDIFVHSGEQAIHASVQKQNLSMAIRNLLINALQAASNSAERWSEIKIHQSTDMCFIDFSDSGEAIVRRDLKNIFSYGFSRSEYGLGIGLSIAKDLIEVSGGRIVAYHDQRLKFRIILPKISADE